MGFAPLIFCIIIGFVVCWTLIPVIRRIAMSRGHRMRAREYHHADEVTVPRCGGVALAAALLIVSLVIPMVASEVGTPIKTRCIIVFGAIAMFALGFLDDLRPVGARTKFLGQILIASAVYFGGIQIEVFKDPFTGAHYGLGIFGFFATVLWLVALTNLINLIDGIDGLAGGIGFMLMCLLASVGLGMDVAFSALLAAGMAGALLGFLYFNYPPAKIYMGDGGAYLIGFLIGLLSITNSHKGTVAAALIAPIFALALPIVDVTLAILRRAFRGLPLFRPDRKHIHHRLIAFGLSRQRAVLVLYTISFLCLFLAFGVFWLQGKFFPLLFGFLFVIFIVALRSFGFLQEWLAAGSSLGKSVALRRETRYALVLAQWFELEGERSRSVQHLWQDYQFILNKLGFAEVSLILPHSANVWRASEAVAQPLVLQRTRHEVNGGAILEFAAAAEGVPARSFELLSELAAEIWHKAVRRWQETNSFVTQSDASTSPEPLSFAGELRRLYAPSNVQEWNSSNALAEPT